MANKKKTKRLSKKIDENVPGLSTDDLEGTLDEIKESENESIREEIDKAKES